jgi:hypothetical protein
MVLEAVTRIEVGQVSSHLLRRFAPAAFLSALVVTLTSGVSAAQAATVIRGGRGMTQGALAGGHGGTSVGLVVIGIVVLALVVGGAVYAIVTDRRLVTAATTKAEPTPLHSVKTEPEQKRKAA